MISERLEPSEALPKINVDASFLSVTAPRARLGHHHCADSHGCKMSRAHRRTTYPSFLRARHDGSYVRNSLRSSVRVRQTERQGERAAP